MGPGGEFLSEAFEGQADDVAVGSLDFFDDEFPAFLDGVGAGFIERVHAGEVVLDGGGVERPESDSGADGEDFLSAPPQMEEADGGDDFVGASGQLFQHGAGFVEGGGFSEQPVFEGDECVGAENEGVGKPFRDAAGFSVGVDLGDFAGGEFVVVDFGGVAGNDLEFGNQLPEQFASARGGGGEDDGRMIHGRPAGRGTGGTGIRCSTAELTRTIYDALLPACKWGLIRLISTSAQ